MGSILHEQKRSIRSNWVAEDKGGDVSKIECLKECPLAVLSKYERVYLLLRPFPSESKHIS